MTYSEKLKDPRWQKKRLEVLERDCFTCKQCGDTETTLHVHHFTYSKNPWESEIHDLITYCKHCHYIVEQEKSEGDDYLCNIYKAKMVGGGFLFIAERVTTYHIYRLDKRATELVLFNSISKSIVEFLAEKLGYKLPKRKKQSS